MRGLFFLLRTLHNCVAPDKSNLHRITASIESVKSKIRPDKSTSIK